MSTHAFFSIVILQKPTLFLIYSNENIYLRTITYCNLPTKKHYIMISTLYDEEDPSSSSPQTAPRRKSRALSRVISAAFRRSKRGDFDHIVGHDPENFSDEALMPIVDVLKREYDKNDDGKIDEEEMVRMLLGAIRMGMKKRNLADENSHLVKKASYLHIYQCSSLPLISFTITVLLFTLHIIIIQYSDRWY